MLNDVFNADKFELFYQCLPNEGNNLSGGMCTRGINKVTLTGMALAIVTGEKLQIFFIGKSATPRSFHVY